MNSIDLFFRLARGTVVVSLAAGLVTSTLPAAQAASAASLRPAVWAPMPKVHLAVAPAPAAARVVAEVPMATTVTATVGCAATYVVKSGDTLWRIGLNYGVAWPQIASTNSLANPALIYAGQSLCVPAASTVPVTTTTSSNSPAVPSGTPTIEVVSVVADQSVTLKASNFPAGKPVDVRLGKNGTLGVGGAVVTTVDAGTGVFTGTYTIPAALKGQAVISIRLESRWGGYYSYNWCYNVSTK